MGKEPSLHAALFLLTTSRNDEISMTRSPSTTSSSPVLLLLRRPVVLHEREGWGGEGRDGGEEMTPSWGAEEAGADSAPPTSGAAKRPPPPLSRISLNIRLSPTSTMDFPTRSSRDSCPISTTTVCNAMAGMPRPEASPPPIRDHLRCLTRAVRWAIRSGANDIAALDGGCALVDQGGIQSIRGETR